jgi:hypothetical protein
MAIHTAIAQNSSFTKNETINKTTSENIFVHLNTTTLVAGETLHCKFYCLNPSNNNLSAISKIAHVEIVNNQNQVVLANKVYLENATGQGDFFIPTTFKTGSYKLIAYTNWMLNKKDLKISETDLFIINPYSTGKINSSVKDYSTTEKKAADIANAESGMTNQSKDETFIIEVDKKTAARREQISVKIKSVNANFNKGSFSLSVKKANTLPGIKPVTSYEFAKSNINNPLANTLNDSILFLPELRGEMVSGSIINTKDSKQIAGKDVALSIPGTDFAFKIAKTNEQGKFNFILDKNPNYSNAVFQVIEPDKNDYSIEISKDNGYDLSQLKFANEINLTSDYKKSIEEQSIANQIENAYYSTKKDSITLNPKTNPFYHPLEKEYILEDYTKFPSLKETIIEVIKEVYYREENNNFTLNVRDINYDLKYFSEPALVLVDGLLIQNTNELVDYKTENIYKISIVPGIYLYGSKAFNGIINFTTKNNDFLSKEKGSYILKAEIPRPQSKTIHFKQDYTDRTQYSRIPDYRYQLLWEPELTLEKTENIVSFFTSDVPGLYEINLEGFTEKGIPVSLKETIEVKNIIAN